MPAYAKDGKVVCFFQARGEVQARYATFGFNDGEPRRRPMWPTSFALTELTAADEEDRRAREESGELGDTDEQ